MTSIVESKEAARYTDNGSPAEHCGNCIHYNARGTNESGWCLIVAGEIKFQGWCRHWALFRPAA